MVDQSNRTFVCSVLFLDIVEYSKRSVSEQMQLKQRLNEMLGQTLQNVAVNDRIVLDTGDGAAISFLGNPEDALFIAMGLRDAIASEPSADSPKLAARLGVNLGPVRLIKDLNGQLNIIGDGINVAQRVMSFAQSGQILVSRSYYEVVSRLAPDYSQLFSYEGARTDKHVREHEVYAVGPGGNRFRVATLRESAQTAGAAAAPVAASPSRFNPRLFIVLPVAMLVIVGAGVAIRMQRAGPVPGASPAAAPAQKTVSAPAATSAKSTRPQAAPVGKPAPAEALPARTAKAAPPEVSTARKEIAEKRLALKKALADEGQAAARLLIVPWGEVIVDGENRGVSPPLRFLQLSPGRHKIEIRNSSFPVYTEQITVNPGDTLTIRHRFD